MSSETLQGKLSRLKSEFSVFFDRLTQQAREEFQGLSRKLRLMKKLKIYGKNLKLFI